MIIGSKIAFSICLNKLCVWIHRGKSALAWLTCVSFSFVSEPTSDTKPTTNLNWICFWKFFATGPFSGTSSSPYSIVS